MTGSTQARGLDLDGPMGAIGTDRSLARDPQALSEEIWSDTHSLTGVGAKPQGARLPENVAASITGTAQRDTLTVGRSLHRPERPV
jgi:hypothetical protein